MLYYSSLNATCTSSFPLISYEGMSTGTLEYVSPSTLACASQHRARSRLATKVLGLFWFCGDSLFKRTRVKPLKSLFKVMRRFYFFTRERGKGIRNYRSLL